MRKIIHWVDFSEFREGRARYMCNRAVYPNPQKSTLNVKEVTCKNCIRPPNKKLKKAIIKGIEV